MKSLDIFLSKLVVSSLETTSSEDTWLVPEAFQGFWYLLQVSLLLYSLSVKSQISLECFKFGYWLCCSKGWHRIILLNVCYKIGISIAEARNHFSYLRFPIINKAMFFILSPHTSSDSTFFKSLIKRTKDQYATEH
jgi:hypothetical protein